jgi:hypothetical protein
VSSPAADPRAAPCDTSLADMAFGDSGRQGEASSEPACGLAHQEGRPPRIVQCRLDSAIRNERSTFDSPITRAISALVGLICAGIDGGLVSSSPLWLMIRPAPNRPTYARVPHGALRLLSFGLRPPLRNGPASKLPFDVGYGVEDGSPAQDG